MIYTSVSAYLIAMRDWFDRQRRAAMRNEPFNEPAPEYLRVGPLSSPSQET